MKKNTILLLVSFGIVACAPQPQPREPNAAAENEEAFPPPQEFVTPEPTSVPAAQDIVESDAERYQATTEIAEVDESAITLVIHVDPGRAPDSGYDGTEERPFPTIMSAQNAVLKGLRGGTATKLAIAPGLYREDLRSFIGNEGEDNPTFKNATLVIEGGAPGKVIVSGSITHNDKYDFRPNTWRQSPNDKGVYYTDWPFEGHVDPGPWIDNYGFALLPGLMQRSESIWMHGKPLRQVVTERYEWVDPDGKRGYADRGTGKGGDPSNQPGSLVYSGLVNGSPDRALDEPWTFCVYTDPQTPEALRGRVFVRVPEGEWPTEESAIEVGLWKKSYAPLLIIRNKDNFVLRNLSLTHGVMGPMTSALALNACRNFIVEDVDSSFHGANGIVVNNCRQGVFLRVSANNNGGSGMASGGSRHMLYEDCETSFNNYRGGWAGWLGWHASGFKSGGVHNITMRRFTAIGNYANGIWYDVYCKDVLVEDSFFLGNKRMGLMFELTKPNGGPQVTRNSIFAYNDNCGVYISMAANSVVEDCLLVGNGVGGNNVEGEPKNTQLLYKFRDHPQGPNSAGAWQSVVVRNNTLVTDDPRSSLIDYLFKNAEPETQYARVLDVLESDRNVYGSVNPDQAFRSPRGTWLNFDSWKALLSAHGPAGGPDDESSVWSDPGMDARPERAFTDASDSSITQKASAMGLSIPQNRIREYWSRMADGLYAPPHLHLSRQHD